MRINVFVEGHAMGSENVFVYGTLLSRYLDPTDGKIKKHKRSEILKGFEFERALLRDYKLLWPKDLGYPFIIPCKGHRVRGEVYYEVGEDTVKRLDAVEGVGVGLFVRERVRVVTDTGAEVEALTYVGGESLRSRAEGPVYLTFIPEEFINK